MLLRIVASDVTADGDWLFSFLDSAMIGWSSRLVALTMMNAGTRIGVFAILKITGKKRIISGGMYGEYLLMNEKLLSKILECPRLPSLPSIAIEVIDLCRQHDINIKQIATTISNDMALSTKILRTVNSSYYGQGKAVTTITHALVILGLNSVKTLALGFSLVSNLKDQDSYGYDMLDFWRDSIYSAVGARTIAQHVGMLEHEEVFLAGLIKELGVMAMLQTLGEEYVELLGRARREGRNGCELEREEYNIDRMEVGGILAEKWKLPTMLVMPIRYSDSPDDAPEEFRQVTRAVGIGAKAAKVFLTERPDAIEDFFSSLETMFDIDRGVGEELLEKIGKATKEMGSLFDINTGSVKSSADILAEANEALLELSLQTQQNATQLEEKNRELQKQATHDALTGVANRGYFAESIKMAFDEAKEKQEQLSVIFTDADHFKNINDTYGHAAGDKVLVMLAELLKEGCPERGLVARYGGEEFAIVMPGYGRTDAAIQAENMRKVIAGASVEIEDQGITLQITVSMGVATFDGISFFTTSGQLVDAADKAVYVAKKSGRNCVRIYSPKPKSVPVG